MKTALVILILISHAFTFAQAQNKYAGIDKLALKIPDSLCKSTAAIAGYITTNFKTDNEKIRAIFFWTTSKISYDIENMFAINFNETVENKISKTLLTKKGVCINYAEIFNALANKAGIKSVVIEGYTKQQGFTDYIPHAWCGAKVDDKWYLFDPTWGSGYISNSKFVKKINEQYFKADPAKIIASHMPFDYIWQFLNYPVTNQEFYTGNIQINKSKTYFDYEKEIVAYENSPEPEKLVTTAERIEKNGIKNAMIFDRLAFKKREIEYYKQNIFTAAFNNAAAMYNEGVNLYNEYVNYRNQQFKPVKPDDEIKKMIAEPKKKLLQAQELLNSLADADANVNSVKKNIVTTLKQVEEQEAFVKEYVSKGKAGRKSMFTKITFFGRPLN